MELNEVVQNYIWVPIVSSVISFFLGIFVRQFSSWVMQKWKKKISQKTDVLNIAGQWISFFHEEKSLQSESVKFEQNGQEITGKISMPLKRGSSTYDFTGQFKNNILVGTYVSANRKKDERGTIVLRYVNEFILSGYCTFVYKNRQVYNSPYVLTAASEHNVDKGTYQFCNSCVGRFDCCCNCKEIDMPILLPFEIEGISRITKRAVGDFSKKLTTHLYQMKRADDDEKNGCIFFQNNKCSIYENRPLDCRLFPFDFKEIDGDYWVIYYDAICKAIPTERDEIDMCAHNMRPILEIIMPYMSECSNPLFSQRLGTQHYSKLFKITEIVSDKCD